MLKEFDDYVAKNNYDGCDGGGCGGCDGGAPDIRIFGVLHTIDECFKRIGELGEKSLTRGALGIPNVISTPRFTFWYKEVNDLASINTSVDNRD